MLDRNIRATVITNPMSGTLNVQAMLPGALAVLRAAGWQIDVQATTKSGDAGRLAAQARDQGQQVVLVAGGDGSLNEAANALAYSEVALGILPSGTANVWARQIGLPIPSPLRSDRLAEAARLLLDGAIRPIDLGRARDRYFVMWSGIGLDAEVTATIEPRPVWVKRLGVISYSVHAIMTALSYRGTRMTVSVDAERIKCRALMVLISNAQLYGAIAQITPDARLDDGLLDIRILKGDGFFQAVRHMLRFLLRRRSPDPELIELRGQRISVTARRQCYVHVDAEPFDRTPITIEVAPKALKMLIPRTAAASLFVNDS
ncbi:MAG TPA: diacylglycerol kinase family protein [Anaerolineae bacterium]|nr:diacylglycerol kinase family protein [Anaerolineae bacterium]